MFDKLKRLWQGEPPPIAEKIEDPALGTLTWAADDEAWVSNAAHAGAGFEFQISGTPEPCKALVAHAADILRRKDAFVAEVLACVRSEGEAVRHLHPFRDEIAGLRVEQVCLFWPDRPDDGMIFLSGGREYRL
jgi:hypothetical protein